MPLKVVSGVGRKISVLDWGGYRRRERGTFGGEFAASHCYQWDFVASSCKSVSCCSG